jgi:hypothetical protein
MARKRNEKMNRTRRTTRDRSYEADYVDAQNDNMIVSLRNVSPNRYPVIARGEVQSGGLYIKITVVEGKKGVFASFPQWQNKDGDYINYAGVVDKDTYAELMELVDECLDKLETE